LTGCDLEPKIFLALKSQWIIFISERYFKPEISCEKCLKRVFLVLIFLHDNIDK
jgi:hypothetical protein